MIRASIGRKPDTTATTRLKDKPVKLTYTRYLRHQSNNNHIIAKTAYALQKQIEIHMFKILLRVINFTKVTKAVQTTIEGAPL